MFLEALLNVMPVCGCGLFQHKLCIATFVLPGKGGGSRRSSYDSDGLSDSDSVTA